ncbi:hypothetical protein CVT25_003180 [Psilocybe cyanescens]|uniref:Uncharacterized protein n=1 Tax=Psilocybe cyanescens TaxID=93625 RepID=A0A409XEZ7_PSICY|nr:hypothetical protein CVT25_003180 [Psilocybe cyanescens]
MLSNISRTGYSLRTLAVRRSAGCLSSSSSRNDLTLARSRKFSSTQTTGANPGEEQKEQETKKEEPRHQRLDGPGGQPLSAPSSRGFTPIITGLLVVGVGLTAYGLYELYSIMHMWPPEIRADLRSGLLAKRKGDLSIASQYLHRAWEHTKTLPLDAFGPDPLLKTTGIGITLGGILEQSSDLAAAYDVYEDVFWALRTAHLRPSAGTGTGSGDGNGDGNGNGNAQGEGEQGLPPPSTRDTRPPLGVETLQGLSSADKMRAVALAYKLGELAHALGRPRAEEERWLVWSVEAILRTVLDTPPVGAVEVVRTVGTGAEGGVGGAEARPNLKVLVEQLGLPLWAMRHDLAAPFEALGTFYAEEGNVPTTDICLLRPRLRLRVCSVMCLVLDERVLLHCTDERNAFALPLYLQAIAILIPPAPSVTPVEDKCAQLMGNITELLARSLSRASAPPEATSQAEAWAQKGLDTVLAARRASPIRHAVCEEALAVLLYNVAMVRELAGDEPRARALLSENLEQARKIDMQEGIQHAQDALRRLDGGAGAEGVQPLVVDRLASAGGGSAKGKGKDNGV